MHIIQQKILRLVDSYDVGKMSFREIGEIIGEKHPQAIKHHLEQLEKHHLLNWDKKNKVIHKINIGVVSHNDFSIIPVLGSANCGVANIFADECVEGHIKVSTKLVKNKKNVFAIKAVGSSMDSANIDGKTIEDGDYVIVDPKDKDIKNNDYVLSIIDDVANIKKINFDKKHNQITLSSESIKPYTPIYLHLSEASKYLVNGKVIQVIKKFKDGNS